MAEMVLTCFIFAAGSSLSIMELNTWSFPRQAWISSGRHSMMPWQPARGPFVPALHFLRNSQYQPNNSFIAQMRFSGNGGLYHLNSF